VLFQFPSLYILSEKCPAVGYCYGIACNHQWLIFFIRTLAANESFLPCKNNVNGEIMGRIHWWSVCATYQRKPTHEFVCTCVWHINSECQIYHLD